MTFLSSLHMIKRSDAEINNAPFSAPAVHRSALVFLKCFVYDISQWCMAVEDVDVESLVAKRAHGIEAFFLARTTAADPNFNPLQLAFRLGFAKSVNDAAECFFDIGKVCNGAPDDNILDAREGADLIGEYFYGPVRWIAGILGIIGELSSAGDHRIRIIDAGAATGRQHGRIASRDLDEFHRAFNFGIDAHH